MLFSTKMRLFKLISGIILLFGGIFYLLLPCIFTYTEYIKQTLSFWSIVGCIVLLLCSSISFYASAKCFIEYGMAKGVDYALEKEKEKISKSTSTL